MDGSNSFQPVQEHPHTGRRPLKGHAVMDPAYTKADKIVLQALGLFTPDSHQTQQVGISERRLYREDSGYESDAKKADDVADGETTNAKYDEQANQIAVKTLASLTNPSSSAFEPTIFTTWDNVDIPWIPEAWLANYVCWAQTIVRQPTDVVFLTHLIIYSTTVLPSAAWLLMKRFSYVHGILHLVYSIWCAGSFTLMMLACHFNLPFGVVSD